MDHWPRPGSFPLFTRRTRSPSKRTPPTPMIGRSGYLRFMPAGEGSWGDELVLRMFDAQDRTMGMVHHFFGHASDQCVGQTGAAMGAQHDQVHILLLGRPDDLQEWDPDSNHL